MIRKHYQVFILKTGTWKLAWDAQTTYNDVLDAAVRAVKAGSQCRVFIGAGTIGRLVIDTTRSEWAELNGHKAFVGPDRHGPRE